MPIMGFAITLPECLDETLSPRAQNRAVKGAVRAAITTHHQKRIPMHFTRGATARYGYAKRLSRYRRRTERQSKLRERASTISYALWKREKYGSTSDLVKTGGTRNEMTRNGKITVGGTATTGLRARLRLKFKWEQRVTPSGEAVNVLQHAFRKRLRRFADRGLAQLAARRVNGVDLAQMKREIQAIRADELAEIGRQVAQEYAASITTGRRRRQRI